MVADVIQDISAKTAAWCFSTPRSPSAPNVSNTLVHQLHIKLLDTTLSYDDQEVLITFKLFLALNCSNPTTSRALEAQRQLRAMDTMSSWPMPDRVITKDELEKGTQLAVETAPNIYRIENFVVKSGDATRLAEAFTMKVIREKTTIPVPKIYNAYVDDETVTGPSSWTTLNGKSYATSGTN